MATLSASALPAELDPKRPRSLLFRIRELRDMERLLHASNSFGGPPSLVDIMNSLTGAGLRIDVAMTVLYCGLKHEDPKLKPQDVEDLVQGFLDRGGSYKEIDAVLGQAFMACGLFRTSRAVEENGASAPGPTVTP